MDRRWYHSRIFTPPPPLRSIPTGGWRDGGRRYGRSGRQNGRGWRDSALGSRLNRRGGRRSGCGWKDRSGHGCTKRSGHTARLGAGTAAQIGEGTAIGRTGMAADRTGVTIGGGCTQTALNKSCTALAPTLGIGERLTVENVSFNPSAFWMALLGVEKLVRQITPDLKGLDSDISWDWLKMS